MGFLVMIFNYALRVNINMTLVDMVKNRPKLNTTYSGECGKFEDEEEDVVGTADDVSNNKGGVSGTRN
jgi:hypothetical protein